MSARTAFASMRAWFAPVGTGCRRAVLSAAALLALVGAAVAARAALPIQHWQTDKGAQVYFVENHDLPMLDLSVAFAAGSSRDRADQSGLAGLTVNMMRLGAGGLSDDDISRGFADVGAVIDTRFDRDMAGFGLRTLSAPPERRRALEVLAKVLQQPEFPEPVLEREKARLLARLKEADTQPESMADKAFYAALYGGHPYGLPPEGEVATVGGLKRQDLADFYRTHYSAANAVIAMIGDITRADAEAIARQLSERLPPGPAPAPLPPVPELTQAQVRYLPHPASQSHILLGAPGMRRGDPDYFPLLVGNYVLGGGGFDSRLTKEVREKRGLAYSAYSYFLPLAQDGPFQIGLQTKKAQTGQAIEIVRKVLGDFVAEGPTAAELQQAKDNLVGGFPLRIDSNKKIIEYLTVIGFYRLPLSYLDDFTSNVAKVTLADVKDAFRRRVHPDLIDLVVVGPAAAGEP